MDPIELQFVAIDNASDTIAALQANIAQMAGSLQSITVAVNISGDGDQQLADLTAAYQSATSAAQTYATSASDTADAVSAAASATDAYSSSANDSAAATAAQASALTDNATAIQTVTTATQDQSAATADNSTQIQALLEGLQGATDSLAALAAASNDATGKIREHGEASQEASVNLHELSATISEVGGSALPGLSTGLQQAGNLFGTLKEASSSEAETLATLGAGFTTLGLAVAGITFEKFESGIESLHQLSLESGMSTTSIAGLQSAMEAAGVSTDKTQQVISITARQLQTMEQAIEDGKEPTGNFSVALDQLGINATDAGGHVLTMGQLLPQIADAFQQQAQAAQSSGTSFNAAGLAVELFGRSGAALVPMLEQGSGAMDQWTQKAQQLGYGSEAQVAALEHWNQASAALHLELNAAAADIGSSVAPVITQLASGITQLADDFNQLPGPVKDLVVVLPAAAGGFLLVASGVDALIGKAVAASVSLFSMSTAVTTTAAAEEEAIPETIAFGAAIDAASGPLGLLIAAAGALAAGYVYLTGRTQEHTSAQQADTVATQASLSPVEQQVAMMQQAGLSTDQIIAQLQKLATESQNAGVAAGASFNNLNAQLVTAQANLQAVESAAIKARGGFTVEDSDIAPAVAEVDRLTTAVNNASTAQTAGASTAADYASEISKLTQGQQALDDKVADVTASMNAGGIAVQEHKQALDALNTAAQQMNKSDDDMAAGEAAFSDAARIAAQTGDDQKASVADLEVAVKNGDAAVKAQAQSTLNLIPAIQNLGAADAQTKLVQDGLTGAIDDTSVAAGNAARNVGLLHAALDALRGVTTGVQPADISPVPLTSGPVGLLKGLGALDQLTQPFIDQSGSANFLSGSQVGPSGFGAPVKTGGGGGGSAASGANTAAAAATKQEAVDQFLSATSGTLSMDQIVYGLLWAGVPQGDVAEMAATLMAENSGHLTGGEPSGAHIGLGQFDAGTWQSVSSAPYNGSTAGQQFQAIAALLNSRGLQPWEAGPDYANTAAQFLPQAQDALNKVNAGGSVSFGVGGGGAAAKAPDYNSELDSVTKQLATDQATLNTLETDYDKIHIMLAPAVTATATATAAVVQQTADLSNSTNTARESMTSAADAATLLASSGSQAGESLGATHDAAVALSGATNDLGNESGRAAQGMGGLGGATVNVFTDLRQFSGYVTDATANANALSSATSGLSESMAKVGQSATSGGDWVDAFLNYKNAPKHVTRDQVDSEGAASDAAGGTAQQANIQAQAAVTAAQTADTAYQTMLNQHLAGDQTITASALASAKAQSDAADAVAKSQVQAAGTAQNAYDTLYAKATTDAAALLSSAQQGVSTAGSTAQAGIQSATAGQADATQVGDAVGNALLQGDNGYAMALLMNNPTQISQIASVASAYITDHATDATDVVGTLNGLTADVTTVGNTVTPWFAASNPNAGATASAAFQAERQTGKAPIDVNGLGVDAANWIAAGNEGAAVADILAAGDQGDAVVSVMMTTIDSYIKHGQISAANATNQTNLAIGAASSAGQQGHAAAVAAAQAPTAPAAAASPYSGAMAGGGGVPVNSTGNNTTYTGYAGGFETLKNMDTSGSAYMDALAQALRNNAAATNANTNALNGNRPHSKVAIGGNSAADPDFYKYNQAAPGSLN